MFWDRAKGRGDQGQLHLEPRGSNEPPVLKPKKTKQNKTKIIYNMFYSFFGFDPPKIKM